MRTLASVMGSPVRASSTRPVRSAAAANPQAVSEATRKHAIARSGETARALIDSTILPKKIEPRSVGNAAQFGRLDCPRFPTLA